MIKNTGILAFLCFNAVFPCLGSKPTLISGNAPAYAGSRIEFMRNADWITGSESMAGFAEVSEKGDFSVTIDLEGTTQLFTHLGIYLGYFFAEQGKTYQIILPEKKDKSPEDILNPYFKPVEIHLALSNFNENELNMQIMMFEDAYGPYYEKHVNDLNTKTDAGNLESDIANIEKPFQKVPDAFFHAFRQYRYGMLKLFANQQKVQSLSDEYFNNRPVLYSNPAYADLFNLVFDKYFVFYGRTEPGKQIYNDINKSGSYTALQHTLSASTNFSNDTLIELIILKQIHDEYYGNQFSRSGLLNILDSLLVKSPIDIHRKFGDEIRKKITRLQAGYAPPPFSLYSTDSLLVNLSDLEGKYVYLNFCTCQSYACLNEFNDLALLHQRQKDRIVIITIATDPMEEVLRQFLARNKYNWMFLLYDNQPDVLKNYDIRAFPTYFLIGPDGKLILSPAPSPSEDFENRLFGIMKSRGDL